MLLRHFTIFTAFDLPLTFVKLHQSCFRWFNMTKFVIFALRLLFMGNSSHHFVTKNMYSEIYMYSNTECYADLGLVFLENYKNTCKSHYFPNK